MILSSESHDFGYEGGDIDDVKISSEIPALNTDIDNTFYKNRAISKVVPIENEDGNVVSMETILGGLVPSQIGGGNDYEDITLVRSEVSGQINTYLVAKGERYNISATAVTFASKADRKILFGELALLRYWVKTMPTVAIWSREDTERLAVSWNSKYKQPKRQ